MIKKIFFALAAFIAIFVTVVPARQANASYEAYYFENFDVEVIVDENYNFHITETLDTVFTSERRGLFRYLPNYWGDNRIKYTDISVSGAPCEIKREKYKTELKIGDPDKTIIGPITYEISYTVNLPKDPSSEIDSVYINLIGHDHPTETYNSHITIVLPKKVDPSSISVVSGYYFDNGTSDNVSYIYKDRQVLEISLLSPLEMYEGITAKINLPEGYFTDVKNPFFFDEFLIWLIPALLVLAGLILWMIYGNDKRIIAPVELSPPDVSPIEAGYIIDGKVNDDDVSAMLIYWASLGLIKIKKAKGHNNYQFKRIHHMQDRPKYEMDVFSKVFLKSDDEKYISVETLKARLGKNIVKLKYGVIKQYTVGEKRIIDGKSKKMSGTTLFLSYLCFALVGFFTGLDQHVGLGIFLGLASTLLYIPLHLWLRNILAYLPKRTPTKNAIRIILYLSLVLLYAFLSAKIIHPWVLNFRQIIAMLASACTLNAISYYTLKLSDYGHKLYERVIGFRHFLMTAEKEWLEELAKDTPEFFYSMLPYALVLGVSRIWIGKFAKAIKTPPEWYESDKNITRFSARTFSSNTVSDFQRISVSAEKSVYRSSSYSSSRSSYSYRPSSSYSSSSFSSSFSSSSSSSGGGFGGGGSSSW